MSQFSRRKFLLTAGVTAVTNVFLNACKKTESEPSTSTASIAPGEAPEVTTAKLGFIALTDSAPLIIAKIGRASCRERV